MLLCSGVYIYQGGVLSESRGVTVYPSFEELLSRAWRRTFVHPLEWASSIISLLFFVFLLIVFIPAGWVNERRHPDHPKSAWNRVFHFIIRTYFFFAGITVEVEGAEHLPPETQPVVLAANHLSHFDGFAISVAIQGRRATAVTAPSQFFPWPFSLWFRRIGAIDVARTREEEEKYNRALKGHQALKLAIWKLTVLQKSILIFPEGHIERHRAILPYKSGAVRMAITAGVPLIPVTIRGSERVFSPNKWLLRPGKIRIIFHPALPLPEKAYVDDHELVDMLTSQLLCRIASELPPSYYSPGMVNACREILALNPVSRAALATSARVTKKTGRRTSGRKKKRVRTKAKVSGKSH